MANINLATENYATEKKFNSYNFSLYGIIFILVVLAAGYAWLVFAAKNAQDATDAANGQYTTEMQKLVSNNNKDVVDFQNRISLSKDIIAQESAGYNLLPAMEKGIVPGVYLKALSYDQTKKTVTAEGVADSFDLLAKQLLSFKKSDYFAAVSTGETTLDDKGKVNFPLNLTIK